AGGPEMKTVNVALIGCGYWGPNLLKSLLRTDGCRVVAVADIRDGRLGFVRERYPMVRTTRNYGEILEDKGIDAVALATPPESHAEIGGEILRSGKHLFVEKPLAANSADGLALTEAASKRRLVLMVGHIFVYHPAVTEIKKWVDDGRIGELCYINSSRLGMRPPGTTVNVVWDLACHDVAMLLHLIGDEPLEVSALGRDHMKEGRVDAAFINMAFPGKVFANIHVGWLMPGKVRKTYIMGKKGAIVFDDTLVSEKVAVYGEGIDSRLNSRDTDSGAITYGSGSVFRPALDSKEPLLAECEHFIECVKGGISPLTGGENGLSTVKVLEAACESINMNARPVRLCRENADRRLA
ncbi:MAG: Gfo/Idh/MocA family oxidoreductase, partial [Deltaproteobacteria bacterium]|nr:Gfo/Idh/MocA family oxidoreductase [Deltaproteobacteria bacterium]